MRYAYFLTLLVCASESNAQDKKSKPKQVNLAIRTEGEYGSSAFSFRFGSQKKAAHHNKVDLVFNTCGLVHISPHGGLKSTVSDLGRGSLTRHGKRVRKSYSDCFRPKAGHIYLQTIDDGNRTLTVKYRVIRATRHKIELMWVPVGKPRIRNPKNRGVAGTLGTCGGSHEEE